MAPPAWVPQQSTVWSEAPPGHEVAAATLHLASDDPDHPDVEIGLVGLGIAPAIELDPPVLTLDDEEVGCVQTELITVRNVGSADLRLDGVEITSTSAELNAVVFEPGHVPGVGALIAVTYHPVGAC